MAIVIPLLFGSVVDLVVRRVLCGAAQCQHLGDGSRQRGLAMVDVTNGADVDVWLVTLKLLLTHDVCYSP
jgi:hypothetical protein